MKLISLLFSTLTFYISCNLITNVQAKEGVGKTGENLVKKSYELAQTSTPKFNPGVLEPSRELPPLPTIPETPEPLPQLTQPQQEIPNEPAINLGAKVKIKEIEVRGSTVFSQTEIEAVIAPFIGKEATFEEILQIRTVITNLYLDNGYSTSGAFLPPQDLTNGKITIQVVEGAIEDIKVEVKGRLTENYIRKRLALAAETPINIRRIEEALQLLQIDPLIERVQAELTQGTAPGLSVLNVKVEVGQPLNLGIGIANLDNPSIGSLGGNIDLSYGSVLGLRDTFTGAYRKTEGLDHYEFTYAIPVTAQNGKLNLRWTNDDSKIIEEPFSELDITSSATTFSVGYSQPIIQKPNREFTLALFLDLRESQTYLLGEPFSFSLGPENGKSRLTVVRFSQE